MIGEEKRKIDQVHIIPITFLSLSSCILDDYNRVVLKTTPEVEHSDYINASYIDVSKVTCHTHH